MVNRLYLLILPFSADLTLQGNVVAVYQHERISLEGRSIPTGILFMESGCADIDAVAKPAGTGNVIDLVVAHGSNDSAIPEIKS